MSLGSKGSLVLSQASQNTRGVITEPLWALPRGPRRPHSLTPHHPAQQRGWQQGTWPSLEEPVFEDVAPTNAQQSLLVFLEAKSQCQLITNVHSPCWEGFDCGLIRLKHAHVRRNLRHLVCGGPERGNISPKVTQLLREEVGSNCQSPDLAASSPRGRDVCWEGGE